ncbi:CsbD-like [Aerococcus viridans]|nr:CsbD family protein [Aerococcus viridans]SUU04946.1 CsbD-like [Aerococcus viridans]
MSNENNGTFDKIKGSVNEAVGKVTGDELQRH